MLKPGFSMVSTVSRAFTPIKFKDLGVEVWGSMERSHAEGKLVECDGRAVVSIDAITTF